MKQFLKIDSRLPPYMAYPRFLLDVDISETAKLVYMLLLDRARLSMKNQNWQDEIGRVFVLYTIPALAKDIGKGETTVKKALNQLIQQNLIMKQSQGTGRPNKIYIVKDDAEMEQLVHSILTQGLLTPLSVRPIDNNEYEVISGHRRLHACKKAGIETVPALIYALNRDEATIAMVDSNLHREKILPSEKAFAYKLKMEAMGRQGQRTDLTSTQVVSKLRTSEIIGESGGDSRETVRRYIRLTELIPEILRMVDDGKIALTPAVELSYLTKLEQCDLLETMESEDCTPSLAQAIQLKKLSQAGELDMDKIFDILQEPKANQIDKISFRTADIRKYFPKSYSAARIQEHIIKLLEADFRKRQRAQER